MITAVEQQFLRLATFLFNAPGLTGGSSSSPSNVTETNSAAILAELQDKANTDEDQYSLLRFIKDGSNVTVNEDTSTPSNNVPLPVKLTGITGDINVSAGDLNVQLSHLGATFDSVRIGDGINLLALNSDGSIKASSSNVLDKYAISRDDTSSIIEYYGFTDISENWYILAVNTSTGEYKYINGSTDFLDNWNNRTTLVYSEFNELTW